MPSNLHSNECWANAHTNAMSCKYFPKTNYKNITIEEEHVYKYESVQWKFFVNKS